MDDDEDRLRKKKFLQGMTTMQQITLWGVLDSAGKVQIFKMLEEIDIDKSTSYQ